MYQFYPDVFIIIRSHYLKIHQHRYAVKWEGMVVSTWCYLQFGLSIIHHNIIFNTVADCMPWSGAYSSKVFTINCQWCPRLCAGHSQLDMSWIMWIPQTWWPNNLSSILRHQRWILKPPNCVCHGTNSIVKSFPAKWGDSKVCRWWELKSLVETINNACKVVHSDHSLLDGCWRCVSASKLPGHTSHVHVVLAIARNAKVAATGTYCQTLHGQWYLTLGTHAQRGLLGPYVCLSATMRNETTKEWYQKAQCYTGLILNLVIFVKAMCSRVTAWKPSYCYLILAHLHWILLLFLHCVGMPSMEDECRVQRNQNASLASEWPSKRKAHVWPERKRWNIEEL